MRASQAARALRLLVCASACAGLSRGVPSGKIISGPFTLWNTSDSHCERDGSPIDLPDTPARAFLDSAGRTVLVAGNTAARFSYGPSVLNTTRSCAVLFNKTNSPDPALYASNEFIHSTFFFTTARWWRSCTTNFQA